MFNSQTLNQHIQQALSREELKQIVVELKPAYHNNNKWVLIIPAESFISLEIIDGILVLEYIEYPESIKTSTKTTFIKPWEDVNCIRFHDKVVDYDQF